MEYPKRKNLRHTEHDYSAVGAYFLTICTQNKRCIFGTVKQAEHVSEMPKCILSPAGMIASEWITRLPEHFPVQIPVFAVMPNHVHFIVEIEREQAANRSTLSRLVGYYKMNAAKQIHAFMPDLEIWQRSYYDHIIRSENDYHNIADYIENNAIKWLDDIYYQS